jgi:hypothetical protein
MIPCKNCQHTNTSKNGFVRGKQRYQCHAPSESPWNTHAIDRAGLLCPIFGHSDEYVRVPQAVVASV